MDGRKLYVAQFVILEEEQWFGPDWGTPIRVEQTGYIQSQLFAALDADEAYQTAIDWLPGFEDAHHDGQGDRTVYRALGIHQIEEVLSESDNIYISLGDMYGLDVGSYNPADIDATGMPLVRDKAQLDIFSTPS